MQKLAVLVMILLEITECTDYREKAEEGVVGDMKGSDEGCKIKANKR